MVTVGQWNRGSQNKMEMKVYVCVREGHYN